MVSLSLVRAQKWSNVNELCVWKDKLYAATDNGIFYFEHLQSDLKRFTTPRIF
jgi:hypothetical protein